LYGAAARLVGERARTWTTLLEDGAAAQVTTTAAQVGALGRGDGGHLRQAVVRRREAAPPPLRYGMCGRLQVWA
jgi:hypothetical protein